jgi:hypothetical protein
MKYALLLLTVSIAFISGCTMFNAWKSIPPPGGCDQCHTLPISTNWQAMYKPATVADERGRLSFQTPENNPPTSMGGLQSPLEGKKVEEKACFDCHKAPNASHKNRTGRFHH